MKSLDALLDCNHRQENNTARVESLKRKRVAPDAITPLPKGVCMCNYIEQTVYCTMRFAATDNMPTCLGYKPKYQHD